MKGKRTLDKLRDYDPYQPRRFMTEAQRLDIRQHYNRSKSIDPTESEGAEVYFVAQFERRRKGD